MFIARKTLMLVLAVIIVTATGTFFITAFYFAAEEKEAVEHWMNEASKYYKEMMRLRELLAKYDKQLADNLTKQRRLASDTKTDGTKYEQGSHRQDPAQQEFHKQDSSKDKPSTNYDSTGIYILAFFVVALVVLYVLSSRGKQ